MASRAADFLDAACSHDASISVASRLSTTVVEASTPGTCARSRTPAHLQIQTLAEEEAPTPVVAPGSSPACSTPGTAEAVASPAARPGASWPRGLLCLRRSSAKTCLVGLRGVRDALISAFISASGRCRRHHPPLLRDAGSAPR